MSVSCKSQQLKNDNEIEEHLICDLNKMIKMKEKRTNNPENREKKLKRVTFSIKTPATAFILHQK